MKELLSDKYTMLWTSAIYGSYGSSGEYTDWKQRGKKWLNIRIGNSDRTIGQVGCLVTFIATEVLGATDTSQHWVALDRVNNNTILMIDPGSNSTDMWKDI